MAGRNPFDKTPRRGRPPKQPPKMSVGRPSNAEVAQQLEMAKITQLPDGPADTEGLTPRQRRILELIHLAVSTRGYPPTIREIGEAAGLASPSSVSHQLRALEAKGYLRRDPHRPRAMEVRLPESVTRGLALTGRVITAAAVIMVTVFASFMLGDERVIKLFGLGLASAVLLDAIVIRTVLVPSIMQLFGRSAWWFPDWLGRILPRLHVEPGEDLADTLHPAVARDSEPLPETE